jgi:hypothetical protein
MKIFHPNLMSLDQRLWAFLGFLLWWVGWAVFEHFKHGHISLTSWIGIAILLAFTIAMAIKIHRGPSDPPPARIP